MDDILCSKVFQDFFNKLPEESKIETIIAMIDQKLSLTAFGFTKFL